MPQPPRPPRPPIAPPHGAAPESAPAPAPAPVPAPGNDAAGAADGRARLHAGEGGPDDASAADAGPGTVATAARTAGGDADSAAPDAPPPDTPPLATAPDAPSLATPPDTASLATAPDIPSLVAAPAEAAERGPAGPVDYACRHCGSPALVRDAWAEWDAPAQRWRINALFDYAFCQSCHRRTPLIASAMPAPAAEAR